MDDARLHRILRQHVLTDQLFGIDRVPVGTRRAVVEAAGVGDEIAETVTQELATAEAGELVVAGVASGEVYAEPASASITAATIAPTRLPIDPALSFPTTPALSREVKLEVLAAIDRDEVVGCTKCELHAGRRRTVFGEGDPDAAVMFIGEGPGQTEDEMGRPFVGRAGELLDKMIAAMGYAREQVYIANAVKCRPPNNRVPMPTEVDACWGYLKRQINTIRPKAIVTLGGPSTKLVLGTDRGITAIRGIWGSFRGLQADGGPVIPVMPTFHPAYLLRSYTPDNRRKVWSDLQKVMGYVKTGSMTA